MISDLSYITEIFCMMSKIFLYLPSPPPHKVPVDYTRKLYEC